MDLILDSSTLKPKRGRISYAVNEYEQGKASLEKA
jgi:predicted HTH domain antitoxin